MRRFLFVLLCALPLSSLAQNQENKLLERLMRPDMSLAYSAADKKFTAVDGTPVNKKFVAKSFYSADQPTTRSFADAKKFESKKFQAKGFLHRKTVSNSVLTKVFPKAKSEFATRKSALIRAAAESEKSAAVREYADNRPFLGQGTRQEQLRQQDKPLTIDEVRELLNKDKADNGDR